MKIQIQKIQLYNFFHYCLLLGTVGLINRNPNYSHKLTHGKLLKQNINLKSKKKGISIDPIDIFPIADKQSNPLSLIINILGANFI